MKIALLGYGKMGKIIEKFAIERGHTVDLKINSKNLHLLTTQALQEVDVAIEFSVPESALKNIKLCLESNTPIAVGTTGWYDSYPEIKALCESQKGCLLAATNFSVGVNLFFSINKQLAKLMAPHSEYTTQIEEIHHTEKLDSPSGTAITIAEQIIDNNKSYSSWVNEKSTKKTTLPIHSLRQEGVPGTHEVIYESDIDIISLKHKAKNRNGFALGAVLAAEYIHHKSGIFTMEDVLNQ